LVIEVVFILEKKIEQEPYNMVDLVAELQPRAEKTPEDVDRLIRDLRSPDENVLEPERVQFFESTLTTNRINCGLSPAFTFYPGGWYYQNKEDTCTPSAVINGSLIVDGTIDRFVASLMINRANGVSWFPGQTGMIYPEAEELLYRHHQSAGVFIRQVVGRQSIQSSDKGLNPNDYLELTEFGMYTFAQKHFDLASQHHYKQIINHNALAIKELVDKYHAILTGVHRADYYQLSDKSDTFKHSICIAGYQINSAGFMNLQIVDSARGIYWISLEHLSQTVIDRDTWMIGKRSVVAAAETI
jgi:hypothetical protein